MKCFFKGVCHYSSEYCLHSNKESQTVCSHFHFGQNIMSRDNKFYGVELLSRPFDGKHFNDLDTYYSLMLPSKHNLLLIEIINKIYSFQNSIALNVNQAYFLNVERFSLLDRNVVESLCNLSRFVEQFCSTLVVEITERHQDLYSYTIEAEYALKDANVLLALDDFTYESFIVLDNTRHDLIKLDLRYVKSNIENKSFIDWLYLVKELNIKLVAERVETRDDYSLALSLPFDYFQGFYEGGGVSHFLVIIFRVLG